MSSGVPTEPGVVSPNNPRVSTEIAIQPIMKLLIVKLDNFFNN